MRAMLPVVRQTLKLVRDSLRRALRLRRQVAWGLGAWLATVAVPYAFLFPDQGLDRSIVVALALLAPVGMLLAALSGEALAVLAAGLCGLVPVLVAAPELQGERTTGPVQGLLVAILSVGFVMSSWDRAAEPGQRTARPWLTLRDGSPLLFWVLAGVWLVLAWLGAGHAGAEAEGARAVRVASVAVCWLAVRLVPLSGDGPSLGSESGREAWPGYVARRLAWVALLGGLWWLWRRTG
jgi:hypothetical protein